MPASISCEVCDKTVTETPGWRRQKGSVTSATVGIAAGMTPEPQAPGEGAAHGLQVAAQPVAVGDDGPRPLEDARPLGREADEPLSAPLDDRHAKLGLQLAQRARERRLGDVARRRRPAEVPLLFERDQKS